MFTPYKKLIAVLIMLWLPLFSGSALAASVAMQMQQGDCHEATMQASSDDDMSAHQHNEMPAADEQTPACSACGVCHLACTGYLAMPTVELIHAQTSAAEFPAYQANFISVTSTPLLPPPLVRV